MLQVVLVLFQFFIELAYITYVCPNFRFLQDRFALLGHGDALLDLVLEVIDVALEAWLVLFLQLLSGLLGGFSDLLKHRLYFVNLFNFVIIKFVYFLLGG